MSLRWTEEQLEEYQKRCKEGVERMQASLICAAEALREFAEENGAKPRRGGAVPPAKIPTEDEEQMALFTWANHMTVAGIYPELRRLFHVPNGGSRGAAEAGRFKAMGVRKGVPDVFLDVPRGGFHGLRVEMKRRRGGILSDEQADWIDYYNRTGYRAAVCYGWDEAREVIEDYLRMKGHESICDQSADGAGRYCAELPLVPTGAEDLRTGAMKLCAPVAQWTVEHPELEHPFGGDDEGVCQREPEQIEIGELEGAEA